MNIMHLLYQSFQWPPHDRLTSCCTHLLLALACAETEQLASASTTTTWPGRPAGDSSLNSAGGGGGGAVAVVGLHLAPVEAAVAPAGGAHERCRSHPTPWTHGTRPRRARRWTPRGCAGTPGSAPPSRPPCSSPPCRLPWTADLAEAPYVI
jgi:hypothetical protein